MNLHPTSKATKRSSFSVESILGLKTAAMNKIEVETSSEDEEEVIKTEGGSLHTSSPSPSASPMSNSSGCGSPTPDPSLNGLAPHLAPHYMALLRGGMEAFNNPAPFSLPLPLVQRIQAAQSCKSINSKIQIKALVLIFALYLFKLRI